MGGTSGLPVPKLRPEDLQDNILAIVGDTLIVVLEKEMVVESAVT